MTTQYILLTDLVCKHFPDFVFHCLANLSQLKFLRRMLEVPKGTPTAALYLEPDILPINFEIEIKQLLYLKRILDKKNDDPVQLRYREMLRTVQ